ncbi:MAG TPA: cyclic nucleotide-binding domain-containing protein [Gemmatimonadales bacterium]|nr:cyclic nucleotide-binding domain-containing protein [Gemmatimonadales bacterium]
MTTSATDAAATEAFPQLTPAQLARIEPHGRRRRLAQGGVLGEPGQPVTKIFVVVAGQLDAVTPLQAATASMPSFTPGMFTGERSIIVGGRFLGRISASVPSVVIEVERDELLKLIQTDTAA